VKKLRRVNRLDVNQLPVSLAGVIRICNACPLPDISQYSEQINCTFSHIQVLVLKIMLVIVKHSL